MKSKVIIGIVAAVAVLGIFKLKRVQKLMASNLMLAVNPHPRQTIRRRLRVS